MGYGEVDLSDAADAGLFAAPAFFVTFREMLECAIVVSVLLGLLNKVNMPHLKRYVWLGVMSASALCIAGAVVVLVLVNVAKEELFTGDTQALVEGSISVIAAVLIAAVALSIGNVMNIHDKIERRLQESLRMQESSGDLGDNEEVKKEVTKELILFLSFTAVAREGVETIIFFVGIGANYPPASLPIPAVVGAVVGLVCGIALYRFGGALTIKWFFRLMLAMLVFIGAGVWTNGMHALQETGAFGTWDPEEDRAPIHQYLFDISPCCGLDNQFWVMMRVLFGYSPNPTGFEILMYLLYHAVVWSIIIVRHFHEKAGKPPLKHVIKYYLTCGKFKPEGSRGPEVLPETGHPAKGVAEADASTPAAADEDNSTNGEKPVAEAQQSFRMGSADEDASSASSTSAEEAKTMTVV